MTRSDVAAVLNCDLWKPNLSGQILTGFAGGFFDQRSSAQRASVLVLVFRTGDDAQRVSERAFLPYFEHCIRPRVGHTTDGVRLVRARRLRLPQPTGATVSGMRSVVYVNNLNGIADQIFVRTGRAILVTLFVGYLPEPFPQALENRLIKTVVARLRAA